MKKAIILGLTILTFGLSTLAQNDNRCGHGAWVADKDPNGTNIRNAPGLHGKIIAVVPHSTAPENDIMIDIIGYSNGWLKVTAAGNVEGTFSFTGIGWISAKKVATSVQHREGGSAPLFALPKRSSKKIGSIPENSEFTIVGHDCFGLKVIYKGKTGWLYRDDICGNVVTTCS
jgi:hypothetical protein